MVKEIVNDLAMCGVHSMGAMRKTSDIDLKKSGQNMIGLNIFYSKFVVARERPC